MYGAESWTLSGAEKIYLVFLRGNFRDCKEWRIRYNQELYLMYQADRIRKQQMRWFGNGCRMKERNQKLEDTGDRYGGFASTMFRALLCMLLHYVK